MNFWTCSVRDSSETSHRGQADSGCQRLEFRTEIGLEANILQSPAHGQMPSTGLGEVSEAGQHADWSLCTPARQVGQQREVAPTWEAESVPMREWETRDTLEPQRGEGTEKDTEVPLVRGAVRQ